MSDEPPFYRPRRLRANESLRRLIQETYLKPADLIYPLFVVAGQNRREAIPSLPDIYRFSVDTLLEEASEAMDDGVRAVLLFGIPPYKDAEGSSAWAEDGPVQTAVRALRKEIPELVVITDVCLCEYTDHGHCGLLAGERILNDPTLTRLARTAVSHAAAGADIVAPSDMMDGRVRAIRNAMDRAGYTETSILSYAVKYASAFYGPFRQAAQSTPAFGDRKSYQMDPPNRREALREALLDIEEGADMLLVKPAMAYLDIVRDIREITHLPLVAYNVSGEYAMLKAAAAQGWIEEQRATLEALRGMKRAGADLIVTYHARAAARWLWTEA